MFFHKTITVPLLITMNIKQQVTVHYSEWGQQGLVLDWSPASHSSQPAKSYELELEGHEG